MTTNATPLNQQISSHALKAVMFDLDGTLIDTAPDFIYVLNTLRNQHQLPPLNDTEIRNTVSNGARALITLGFGLNEGENGFEALKQQLLDLYGEHLAVKSGLFEGMATLLEEIQNHGLLWGIATNKPERYTVPLIAALGLRPDCVICPDHVQHSKPHPESLLLAASQLSCTPEQILYVGDHERDIRCGNDANSPTVAAAYGYIDQGDDISCWQATYIAHNVSELQSIIQSCVATPQ